MSCGSGGNGSHSAAIAREGNGTVASNPTRSDPRDLLVLGCSTDDGPIKNTMDGMKETFRTQLPQSDGS
jgi:hypothetical protein